MVAWISYDKHQSDGELGAMMQVYAVASEDMDSLTFGSTRFLRHLMEPTSRKIPVMEFEIAKVLQELNLTMDQFVDLCILCGCDYCDTIRGGCFSSWRPPSHTFHFRVQHQNLAGTQTVGS
jgi:hypothetical protein